MSEKHTIARKTYWSKMSKEEKSRRMRAIALTRQKNMTFAQRREHSLKMVQARLAKQNKKLSTPPAVVV
jgi:hypothetical protein